MKQISKVRAHATGRTVVKNGPINVNLDETEITLDDLDTIGVNVAAMDSALLGPGVTAGALRGELLEAWLPGVLRTITQVRNIDEIAGVTTIGRFEDDTINVRTLEPTAKPELYGDDANIPLANYSTGVESRGIVRFEQGFQVGILEQSRQSAQGFEAAAEKRRAVAESLDRIRNEIGFKGFLSSDNTNVYGLLNDPSLPSYKSYSDSGAGGQPWLASGTFASVTTDLTVMISAIESQMGTNLPDSARLCLVMPTGYRKVLMLREANTAVTVMEWIRQSFSNTRVIFSPELIDAGTGNKDAVYMFLEDAGSYDESDMTSASLIQAVPERFRVIGSENRVKGYIEDAVNATAGVIVLRPWAFCRYIVEA